MIPDLIKGADRPVIWRDASYKSNPPGSDGQPLPCAQSSRLVDSPANCSSAPSVNALSSNKNSNPAESDGQSSMHHFHITWVWLIEQLQHSFRWMRRLLRIDPQDERLRQIGAGDIEQGGCLHGDPKGPGSAFELKPQREGESCRGSLLNTSNDFVERYYVDSESILALPSPVHLDLSERPSCGTHFLPPTSI